uniref:ORF35 n=1 Tax=Nitrosopumilaceae spindle-shaped virus TaxID=3065433 RepID=A0AAT9JFZ9_9VIRU
MKVFDELNEKWYHKGELITESYKVFLEDGTHTKKEAMALAKQYVRENTLATLKQVNEWRQRNQ